jgi:hypothetical protein
MCSPKPHRQRRILSPARQRFMVFEGLLAWTSAVVVQARRVTEAHARLLAALDRRTVLQPGRRPEGDELILDQRLAHGFFQTERHLFCNVAYQLLEHRRWIKRLNFIDEALFLELDKFAHDIDVMRDMNEHVIEYFEGKGMRPHDWDDGGGTDASSTFNTKIGGRLDWVELGAAAQRLLEPIKSLGPFFPTPEEHEAELKTMIHEASSGRESKPGVR